MAYVRVYYKDAVKWAAVVGVGIPVIFLLFSYLVAKGGIEITGYSNTDRCDGNEINPCIAIINFTAKKDIYIYPNESWTIFNTDQPLEKVTFQRSWGSGWRTIDLNKTWSKNVKYSIKFATGQSYTVRILGYKTSSLQNIKWSFGDLDPWWNNSFLKKVADTVTNDNATITYSNFVYILNRTQNLNYDFANGYYNYTKPVFFNTTKLVQDRTIQSDCDDIRIVNSGETSELPYEFENVTDPIYGCGNNTLIFVKADSIPTGSSNAVFVYYNYSDASAGENRSGVWNNSYISVIHPRGNGTHIFDSSNNNFTWNYTGDILNGLIGRGVTFDNTREHMNATGSTTDQLNIKGDFTFQSWLYARTPFGGGSVNYLFGRFDTAGTTGFQMQGDSTTNFRFNAFSSGETTITCPTTAVGNFPVNKWTLVTVVRENTTTDSYKIYYNDTLMWTCSDTQGKHPNAGSAKPFYIGTDASSGTTTSNWTIDEVRILNRSMTQDEINATFRGIYSSLQAEQAFSAAINVTLYFNRTSSNQTFELFSPINITAKADTSDAIVTIYSDNLGINLMANGTEVVSFLLNNTTNVFGTLNDSSIAKNKTFASSGYQTDFLRQLHRNDSIDFAYINLSGFINSNQYPKNVTIDVGNDGVNDIVLAGNLSGKNTFVYEFNDSSTSKNFTFNNSGTKIAYISLPKKNVSTALMNVTGYDNIVTGVFITITSDTYIRNTCNYVGDSCSQNFGTNTGLVSSGNPTDATGTKDYTYLRFPISAFHNSTITNATVQLSVQSTADGQSGVGLYRANFSLFHVIQTWYENFTTWNNKPINETIPQATTFINCTFEAGLDCGRIEGTPIFWNVTDSIQNLVNNKSSDVNYVLLPNNNTWATINNPTISFYSKEYANFASPPGCSISTTPCPYLNMSYRGYPTLPTIQIGSGADVLNVTRKLTTENTTIDFARNINDYLSSCTLRNGYCDVPIYVHSDSVGIVELSAINITTSISKLDLNKTAINKFLQLCSTSKCNVTLNISSKTPGIVELGGLNVSYFGSGRWNVTVEAVSGSSKATQTLWLNTTWSRFNSTKPYTWTNAILFYPKTNESKNVTPYGQTNSVPIFNISSLAYDKAFNVSIGMANPLDQCINYTFSNTSNKSAGFTTRSLNTTLQTVLTNVTPNMPYSLNSSTNKGIWLWADYNCNRSVAFYSPNFTIKSCCMTCLRCY